MTLCEDMKEEIVSSQNNICVHYYEPEEEK